MEEVLEKSKILQSLESTSFSDQEKMRSGALERVLDIGFPKTKDEYWKYTRVGAVVEKDYSFLSADGEVNLPSHQIEGLECQLVVFVNGQFRSDLSTLCSSESYVISALSEAKTNHPELVAKHLGKQTHNTQEVFSALNTAYHQDGLFIYVKANHAAPLVHAIFLTNGQDGFSCPRNLVIVERSAQASLIQSFESIHGTGNFSNVVSEFVVAENAALSIDKVQYEAGGNTQICNELAEQGNDSRFKINTITLQGKLVRNNLNINVDGSGCDTILNGLFLTKENQHVDNHTRVDHRKPNCTSSETYKGVLNDASKGVFNGKVYVHKIAQKTNAYQSNANLLLTDTASVFAKPELEIYADDVKCSHGSTTGQLDEEALFYLKARGIGAQKARNLLLTAFANDVVGQINCSLLEEKIKQYVFERYQV